MLCIIRLTSDHDQDNDTMKWCLECMPCCESMILPSTGDMEGINWNKRSNHMMMMMMNIGMAHTSTIPSKTAAAWLDAGWLFQRNGIDCMLWSGSMNRNEIERAASNMNQLMVELQEQQLLNHCGKNSCLLFIMFRLSDPSIIHHSLQCDNLSTDCIAVVVAVFSSHWTMSVATSAVGVTMDVGNAVGAAWRTISCCYNTAALNSIIWKG